MKDKKIKVFFDGSCKVCSKEISYYNKHDKNNKFNWIDLNSRSKDLKSLVSVKMNSWNLFTSSYITEESLKVSMPLELFGESILF